MLIDMNTYRVALFERIKGCGLVGVDVALLGENVSLVMYFEVSEA